MIPVIFKDKDLQKEFDEQGYVKVSLLDCNDIDTLTRMFYQFHSNIQANSFGASSFIQNKSEKIIIRDTLFPIFSPYFEKLFINYSYFGSSYLYKTKGKDSQLAPHQDWSIVDEKKFVAINIWTPLIDTNENNGTLYVLPKSQSQKHFTLRAPTIPFNFQNKIDKVIKNSIATNAKAGEAVILNQSLIHFSSPNLIDEVRIAITSGIKSKGAPMLFHYKNGSKDIERYIMPEDFLLDFDDFANDIYKRPEKGKFDSIVKKTSIWDKLLNNS